MVIKCVNGPIDGMAAYVTLGLSEVPLASPVSDKEIRHELVLLTRSIFGDRNFATVVQQLGMEAIAQRRAFVRGEVIGPRGSLFDDTYMEALFVCSPVYLPDSFSNYVTRDGHPCVFAWLVPITSQEAAFVSNKGWREFEKMLIDMNPDLLDINRCSIVPLAP